MVCFQRVFWANIARSLSTVKENGSFECSTIKDDKGVEREGWKGRSGKGGSEHPTSLPCVLANLPSNRSACEVFKDSSTAYNNRIQP